MILIFIGIIFGIYYFSKTLENLEINENKILNSNSNINMNPNKSSNTSGGNNTTNTTNTTNKTIEEAELDSYKNPIKWNCVNQCKTITDSSLKRVCIDVCLNKKIIDKKNN